MRGTVKDSNDTQLRNRGKLFKTRDMRTGFKNIKSSTPQRKTRIYTGDGASGTWG